jgi:hypothetical protein
MGTAVAQPNIASFVIGQRVRYNDQVPCAHSRSAGVVLGYDWKPPLEIARQHFSWELLIWVLWDRDPEPWPVHPCWLEFSA